MKILISKPEAKWHRICTIMPYFYYCILLLVSRDDRTMNVCTFNKSGNTTSSMTTLLTQAVAHSTRPFFRPKTDNQPLKKFLSLSVNWVKVIEICKILMSIFMSKMIRILLIYQYFFQTWIFERYPIFDNFNQTDHKT